MKGFSSVYLIFGVLLILFGALWAVHILPKHLTETQTAAIGNTYNATTSPGELPQQKVLATKYHIFQSFNNCAPAALSMALSYFDIMVSQKDLAEDLRPYNNPKGFNDDKSTPPEELAEKAREYGLLAYVRANGDIELLKKLIALDIPIVMRTLLVAEEDYAHYRIVKGYDDTTGEIIQDDSLQGKNLRYSYENFLKIWKPFNYAYLILVPREKQAAVEAVLGDEVDPKRAWKGALLRAEKELARNPGSVEAQFNKATAYYYLGEYPRVIEEFEKVESRLTRHVLWYQIEPIAAYFEVGNYPKVFSLSDTILNDNNRAFTELYLLRGESYRRKGDIAAATLEFERALFYNKNSKAAKEAAGSLRE